MPRSVAAIFGFALVAFSIGFNTMRYPAVWDMVGPATAGEPMPSEATPPEKADVPAASTSSEPVPPQDVVLPVPSSAQGDNPNFADTKTGTVPAPAPEVSGKRPIENPPPSKEGRPSGNEQPAAGAGDSAQPERLAPLEPVTQFPSLNASANDVTGGEGIRRLPPVDQIVPNPNSRDVARFSNGSIPVYPSTGF